jgi:GTP-binding protein EngB required for normal cell division
MSDPVLEDLRAQISARRVIAVVGSGTSIAATRGAPTSSWVGLLKHGVERCVHLQPDLAGEWQARALGDVTSHNVDDLLAGASKISRTLRRHGEWARWLEDTIGALQAVEPEVLDAIGNLEAPILTTNYDDLLERRLNRVSITLKDRSQQIAFARLECPDAVLHLHGWWRQPETVVMDLGDYERVVRDALAQTGLRTMGEAWSFVFIGCGDGLADPNFEQFLNWMSDVLTDSSHRHFRLERARDVALRQAWHSDRGHRIRVLSYGEEHRDLHRFVATLHPSSDCRPPATRTQVQQEGFPARPTVSPGEYIRLQERGRAAVRKLIVLANQLGFESIASHAAEISEALEQEPYRVAITGRSRAGKSTLLNLLVSREICPVGRVMTTAIPIIIGPGEREAARVSFEGNVRPALHLDGPITADMLAPYANQRHNPDNAKSVDRIEVQLANDVLDLGVEYVDIPGFDDPSDKILSATFAAISATHALVLVVDVSTYDTGGFALDKATRELLEACQRRACPVLIVCNKADRLSSDDKSSVVKHLTDQLDRFGLLSVLGKPPYVLSARDATEARAGQNSVPRAIVAFEEGLWEQLWNSESIGLRRLHSVFDGLRVADEEVTALMSVRTAKAPERALLRDAFNACRRDLVRIRSNSIAEIEGVRAEAATTVEAARLTHLRLIDAYVSALPTTQPVPTVSAALEALKQDLAHGCRSALKECGRALNVRHKNIEGAVSRSLSRLREAACPSVHSTPARATLEALSRLVDGVAVPGSSAGDRAVRVTGAGVGTFAAIGLTVGGPLGWLAAGAAGLIISAIVDHLIDTVGSREELRIRLTQDADSLFGTLRRDLDEAIARGAETLDRHVCDRMEPFLRDMETRLEAIREPTTEELRLHEEVRQTTSDALELLVGVLGRGDVPHGGTPASAA